MGLLFDFTGRVGAALAFIAKLILAAIVILVTADVAIRNLGRPMAWSASLTEYMLIYATFLPMPALVRSKGHVCADFLRTAMPAALQRMSERFVYLLCIGICGYLGLVAGQSLIETAHSGAYEMRSFDMPRWLIYLPMTIGLWLSAVEFARFLLGSDSLYVADSQSREGF